MLKTEHPKVGIIGLGEAGNLGDDLILIATIDAVFEALPDAEIKYLTHGQKLDWNKLSESRNYPSLPTAERVRFEVPLLRQRYRIFQDRDVVIFGGGGLLQTSHDPDRPFSWLSFLPPAGNGGPRVLATGLGLGPLSDRWTTRLRNLGQPFDSGWLRDADSVELAHEHLGWSMDQCQDFIDKEFLATIIKTEKKPETRNRTAIRRRLGVALRVWPGFSVEDAVSYINRVAQSETCEEVKLFVLEANHGEGIDVDFHREIASRLVIKSTVEVYRPENIMQFINSMSDLDVAISMKLHSSAIWSFARVPMYPIYYAPKVASFFGREYRGFEISETRVLPVSEVANTPRSKETILEQLPLLANLPVATGARLSSADRLHFQSRAIARALARRMKTVVLRW